MAMKKKRLVSCVHGQDTNPELLLSVNIRQMHLHIEKSAV